MKAKKVNAGASNPPTQGKTKKPAMKHGGMAHKKKPKMMYGGMMHKKKKK